MHLSDEGNSIKESQTPLRASSTLMPFLLVRKCLD